MMGVMVYQMYILRQALCTRNVAWWDETEDGITRTVFEHNGIRWSVINDLDNHELLEINNGINEINGLRYYQVLEIIFGKEQQ